MATVVKTPIKCSKCGQFDSTTDIRQRCNDCCFMRKRDESNRLLASRCRDCCPSGHGTRPVIAAMTIELDERMDLLDANKRNLQSRLLAVDTPEYVIANAERLEREAEKIFDMAQRIRGSLEEDTRDAGELTRRLVAIECELFLCKLQLQQGIKKCSKGYLEGIVETFLKSRLK